MGVVRGQGVGSKGIKGCGGRGQGVVGTRTGEVKGGEGQGMWVVGIKG